eukprot:3944657-Prymnesium_polylepis.1
MHRSQFLDATVCSLCTRPRLTCCTRATSVCDSKTISWSKRGAHESSSAMKRDVSFDCVRMPTATPCSRTPWRPAVVVRAARSVRVARAAL